MEVEDVHEQVPPTELEYLSNIALKVYHSNYGSYLTTFADLWLRADKDNKVMLRSVWEETIRKYDLEQAHPQLQAHPQALDTEAEG